MHAPTHLLLRIIGLKGNSNRRAAPLPTVARTKGDETSAVFLRIERIIGEGEVIGPWPPRRSGPSAGDGVHKEALWTTLLM